MDAAVCSPLPAPAAAPLTLIKELKDPSAPDYAEWVAWGNDILTTGLFAIIICGTLGVMAIHYSAPLLLQQATEEGKEGASSEGTPDAAGGLEPGGGAAGGGDGGAAPGAPPPKRAASAGPPFRPVSPALGSIIVGEDAALVAEYINAINVLTTTLTDGKANRQEVLQRVGQVSDMQRVSLQAFSLLCSSPRVACVAGEHLSARAARRRRRPAPRITRPPPAPLCAAHRDRPGPPRALGAGALPRGVCHRGRPLHGHAPRRLLQERRRAGQGAKRRLGGLPDPGLPSSSLTLACTLFTSLTDASATLEPQLEISEVRG
jgi:hypothetical protein